MDGELKKLKIEAYSSIDYGDKVTEFVVMFNPTKYSQKYEVEYEDASGQGTSGSSQTFGRIKPQEYTFEFLFDGTGITAEKKEVSDEVDAFLTVCGKMDGDIHRPFYLQISWGTLISRCILKTAEINYSLFRPDGTPLRAKVRAAFTENIEDELRTAEEGKNSPDLTHYRVVQDGDTLPIMTWRMYGDLSYYPDIARINGLKNFRSLQTGMRLRFPPLKQTAAS
ncbi:MAG: LysM peptidoglycan-binding domain-containing protein [Chitinivibrionales bacterium]|nr:LysM peptidoglycan-binding domain-containing protein [Chitinivibrionales bacterium]